MEEEYVRCERKMYVKPWKALKIQLRNAAFTTRHITEDDDNDTWEYEYDSDTMADLVQAGDNFVVVATENNDEAVSFYILQC